MKYEATFNSSLEMKQFYDCFVWKMPSRCSGRSTIHVETILFADFILHFLKSPFWDYPVTVKYDDRPDFIIQSERGIIGIEITEQKSQSYGHAIAFLEKSDGFLEPSDFRYNDVEKKVKGKEIGKLVSKKQLTGPPSMGCQEEINWIKRTLRTTKLKHKKYINYPNYKEFNENYLIIFDIRPESPIFEGITSEMLNPLYSDGADTIFGKIFCLDSHIVSIDLKQKEFQICRTKHIASF
jgi:hypothetical protein